jgi:hypothetical protein
MSPYSAGVWRRRGEAREPLVPGRNSQLFNAATYGFFYLDGTVPIEIKVPGLCESGFVGDVKPLKCGTSESYTEPSNLEQFVQENRVK